MCSSVCKHDPSGQSRPVRVQRAGRPALQSCCGASAVWASAQPGHACGPLCRALHLDRDTGLVDRASWRCRQIGSLGGPRAAEGTAAGSAMPAETGREGPDGTAGLPELTGRKQTSLTAGVKAQACNATWKAGSWLQQRDQSTELSALTTTCTVI